MSRELMEHIRKFVSLDEASADSVSGECHPESFKKKAFLLREGQLCRKDYFVVSGCLRMFFIDEKGQEQTTHFAIENWWMSDYRSYEHQTPSVFFIQAVEDTRVLSLERDHQERLFTEVPVFCRYYGKVLQRAYAASQLRVKLMKEYSREALYHHFVSLFPDFVRRVPQYMLASYLGFTPEYLSEIRKKNKRKQIS